MEIFSHLLETEKTIQPLTKASLYMQRDCNSLADALNMFGMIYHSFGKTAYHCELHTVLENKWNQQEQPLFFLAFFLHPKYAGIFRRMALFESKLSVKRVVQHSLLQEIHR
jgi:hypothetical protein